MSNRRRTRVVARVVAVAREMVAAIAALDADGAGVVGQGGRDAGGVNLGGGCRRGQSSKQRIPCGSIGVL